MTRGGGSANPGHKPRQGVPARHVTSGYLGFLPVTSGADMASG